MEAAPAIVLLESERLQLLNVASGSIAHRMGYGQPLLVNPLDYSPTLRSLRATFVTLHLNHQLRGCIGTLEARRPLVTDVACNAAAAAFEDPRFPPVSLTEMLHLEIHLSILGPSEPMPFESEEDLVRQLRPRIDGLILQDGLRRGTFLPAVWETLPEPRRFLQHLKLKAGLSETHWSKTLRIWRYEVVSVP